MSKSDYTNKLIEAEKQAKAYKALSDQKQMTIDALKIKLNNKSKGFNKVYEQAMELKKELKFLKSEVEFMHTVSKSKTVLFKKVDAERKKLQTELEAVKNIRDMLNDDKQYLTDSRNEYRHLLRDSEYDRKLLAEEKEKLRVENERLRELISNYGACPDCGDDIYGHKSHTCSEPTPRLVGYQPKKSEQASIKNPPKEE